MEPITPEELVESLAASGFLPPSFLNHPGWKKEAIDMIAKSFREKGSSATITHLLERAKRSPLKHIAALQMVLSDIRAKKPLANDDETANESLVISEEIASENKAMQEIRATFDKMAEQRVYARDFTPANDPRFDKSPSIFDSSPYNGLPEEKKQAYKANTFIAVWQEAHEKGTSMHEICRQKGLFFDALLI